MTGERTHEEQVAELRARMEALKAELHERQNRERQLYLYFVDEIERALGISPRTAEIRDWYKRRGV